jgi:hypothetical protein
MKEHIRQVNWRMVFIRIQNKTKKPRECNAIFCIFNAVTWIDGSGDCKKRALPFLIFNPSASIFYKIILRKRYNLLIKDKKT